MPSNDPRYRSEPVNSPLRMAAFWGQAVPRRYDCDIIVNGIPAAIYYIRAVSRDSSSAVEMYQAWLISLIHIYLGSYYVRDILDCLRMMRISPNICQLLDLTELHELPTLGVILVKISGGLMIEPKLVDFILDCVK